MKNLAKSLVKRIAKNPNKSWTTKIIFKSCHSAENIRILNKLIKKDKRMQGHSFTMLSSSSENTPSYKMAGDSWLVAAKKAKAKGEVLTWGKLYREIESKNFKQKQYRYNF